MTFTPQGTGYLFQSSTGTFDNGLGGAVRLPLEDDDSEIVSLPFSFRFFGITYNTIFTNTDGNLTFGTADDGTSGRNLRRPGESLPRCVHV